MSKKVKPKKQIILESMQSIAKSLERMEDRNQRLEKIIVLAFEYMLPANTNIPKPLAKEIISILKRPYKKTL